MQQKAVRPSLLRGQCPASHTEYCPAAWELTGPSDSQNHQMWEIKTHHLFTSGYKQWKPFNPLETLLTHLLNEFWHVSITLISLTNWTTTVYQSWHWKLFWVSTVFVILIIFNGVMCHVVLRWEVGPEEDTSLLIVWWGNPLDLGSAVPQLLHFAIGIYVL